MKTVTFKRNPIFHFLHPNSAQKCFKFGLDKVTSVFDQGHINQILCILNEYSSWDLYGFILRILVITLLDE